MQLEGKYKMAYENGNYFCDSCGVKKGPVDGWKVGNSAAICPKCQLEMKVLKLQEEELDRKKNEFKKSKRKRDNTFSGSSSAWEKFLVIMKWIFSFVWGGPYLTIQGYKTQNKFWVITGIEFTIVFVVSAVLVNVIPDLTEPSEPIHVFLSNLIGGLLFINIMALVVYLVKYRD